VPDLHWRPALMIELTGYGDYYVCPNHDEAMSAAHGESCPECGWPEVESNE